jgi:hypothetical protein
MLFLKYFQTNSQNEVYNKYFPNKKLKINANYWKQKPFIQISTNSSTFAGHSIFFISRIVLKMALVCITKN